MMNMRVGLALMIVALCAGCAHGGWLNPKQGGFVIQTFTTYQPITGENTGTITTNGSSFQFAGDNAGVVYLGGPGAQFRGENDGDVYVSGAGTFVIGSFAALSSATNLGEGSLLLANLTAGQRALITDVANAALVLGAGTASNAQCIVVGDGNESHGARSVTADSFWASGSGYHGNAGGVTNVPASSLDLSSAIVGGVSDNLVDNPDFDTTASWVNGYNMTVAGNGWAQGDVFTQYDGYIQQSLATTAGRSYRITMAGVFLDNDGTPVDHGAMYVVLGSGWTAPGAVYASTNYLTETPVSYDVTATADNTVITIGFYYMYGMPIGGMFSEVSVRDVTDEVKISPDEVMHRGRDLYETAVLLESHIPQISATDTALAFTPRAIGDELVVHTATQAIYRAFGTTTNDWVQVWP